MLRCLTFRLSGPCELLFLIGFIASWNSVVVSVMLYPGIASVSLLMDLFVLSVCELFVETIRNIFACDCYFVVECYGSVECGWRCSIG